MKLTKEDVRKDCPNCKKVIIQKPNRFFNMVMFWGSVHGKCPHCDEYLAYGCLDMREEKFVIITQERHNEIRKQAYAPV